MAGQLREVALDVAVGDAQPALVGLAEQAGSNQLAASTLRTVWTLDRQAGAVQRSVR
jgi:hypothetical protein